MRARSESGCSRLQRSSARPWSLPTYLLGADGVVAAVHVEDLAGRGGEPVGQQGDTGLGDGGAVGDVPAEGGAGVPHVLERRETGDRPRRQRLDRAGGDEVDPDLALAEIA